MAPFGCWLDASRIGFAWTNQGRQRLGKRGARAGIAADHGVSWGSVPWDTTLLLFGIGKTRSQEERLHGIVDITSFVHALSEGASGEFCQCIL